MRRVVVVGLVVLVVGCCLAGVAVGHPAETAGDSSVDRLESTVSPSSPAPALRSASTASTATDDEIRMTTTLDRTPERTGEITATISFGLSSRVTELTAVVPEGSTVTATNGFSQSADREYTWDEQTTAPAVSYRLEADSTVDEEGPLAEDGRYLFADTDAWALVRIPSTGVRWTRTGGPDDDLAFVRETAVDGPGAAGDRIAFLGEHRTETHTAHGQTFRLVVPDAAELAAPVDEIFASLSHASDALRVGSRDDEVFIVAAPTDDVGWAVRGLQTGESDLWVQDSEPLDSPLNVWIHEYVHTRQAVEPTDQTEWLIEAGATYYAAQLTLEQNRIEFAEFERFLQQGETHSAVLAAPESWQADTDYEKGALVAGELDRQIRLSTDSRSSFERVLWSLNSHDGELSAAAFEQYVTDASTTAVGAAATRYTTTDDTPQMWSSDDHATAFGQTPARFSFELAADEPLVITARNGSTRSVETVPRLTVGESLTVRLTVRNIGDTVGRYELPFSVASETSTETGRLTPGETATHEFSHTFDEPGSYIVVVGDERFDVRVEPAESQLPVDVDTAGFGPTLAVVAVVIGSLALGRRRS